MWPDLFGDVTAMEIVKHNQIFILLPSFPPLSHVSNLSQTISLIPYLVLPHAVPSAQLH